MSGLSPVQGHMRKLVCRGSTHLLSSMASKIVAHIFHSAKQAMKLCAVYPPPFPGSCASFLFREKSISRVLLHVRSPESCCKAADAGRRERSAGEGRQIANHRVRREKTAEESSQPVQPLGWKAEPPQLTAFTVLPTMQMRA